MNKDIRTLIIDSLEQIKDNCAAENKVSDLLGFQMQIEHEIATLVQMHNDAGLAARRQNKRRRQSVILGLKDYAYVDLRSKPEAV